MQGANNTTKQMFNSEKFDGSDNVSFSQAERSSKNASKSGI